MEKILISLVFSVAVFYIARYIIYKINDIMLSRKIFRRIDVKKNNPAELIQFLIILVAQINKKIAISRYKDIVKKRIENAGIAVNIEVNEFLAIKELTAFATLIIYITLVFNIDLIGILMVIASFYLPDLWLKEKRAVYEKRMRKDLVYFIDMLTICVEAGLSFDNAVYKYINKSKKSYLRSEFEQILLNIKMGQTRIEALKAASKKINLSEFTSFIMAVTQSIKMGTNMINTLRAQSVQIRDKRIQMIEKMAMKAPVKLLMPLVVFIFPVIFIVIFGPIIIKLLNTFN